MIEHRRTTSNKCEGCRCSLNGSSVVLTDHVIKRMTERNVSMTEMIEALRFGRISVDEHGVSVFTLQEDKLLLKRDENEILNMSVDIVPNKKLKRMPYNFENFQELFRCLKSNRAIPYVGEDL